LRQSKKREKENEEFFLDNSKQLTESCTMTTRLSLTMIVKNEAATLGRCLASVRDIVDEIVVVDTGSSDNTKDIARQYGARVFDFPWCDNFAAARNESIRQATGQWLLWLDADEYFDDANRAKLRDLLANLGDDNTAYVMKCVCVSGQVSNTATHVDHVRLFRSHPALRWDYRVHEQILPALQRAGHAVRFTNIAITHTGYTDPTLRYKKLERNLRLLHLDLAERPNDAFTLFNLGWAFADLGRIAEAIPLLQRSLQYSHNADSITPKLYSLLTQCHHRLGQFEQAWAVCQAGHVRHPEDAELLFLKGQLCRQRGDRAGARACWVQLLSPSPTRGEGWGGGQVSTLHPTSSPPGEKETWAEGAFTSIDAGLRGPWVRHHLALLDRDEGNFADAETHWQTILDEAPEFHPARLGLAELYLRQERWLELEKLLGELRAHAPLDAALLHARLHLAQKQFGDARRLLEEVLRQAPNHLPAHVLLSHVLLQAGDETAAEPQLRRIVELDPGQAESWRNLAVLYRRTGRWREAIAAARAGCLHCPQDAHLLLLHGALLQEAGDALNAETYLLRVLELAGDAVTSRSLRLTARQHLIALYRHLGRHREADAQHRALAAESPDMVSHPQGQVHTNGQTSVGLAR
jgi:tetratricopeptide (TPR) repeat protein